MATLEGTDGSDFLVADAEHNILLGKGGNDTLNGGSVFAFAAYWASPGPVGVQLFSESATDGYGPGSIDTLQNIHGVFGSAFNDAIMGSNLTDVLVGLVGDDTLAGLGGDDVLNGGGGNDF